MATSGVVLQFLGSGDAFGNGGRLQTCFRLRGGEQELLIDCGATSLTALKAAAVEPNEIEWVLVTHLHGDHFGGIPFLVLDGQFRRRQRPLTIVGPPGTRERTERAMDVLFPGSSGARRRFQLRFRELEPGVETSLGPATVTAFPVEQPETPACALRIEYAGRVVAYTGDTAWSEQLVELARGADLLVAEAYFFEQEVPYHLSYATLVRQLDRLDCRRIVLTHMSPDMLARRSEARFECAEDGLEVEI